MAAVVSNHDPGLGGGNPQVPGSCAERLKTNVNYDQRLKRNVLEIVLEKTEKDAEMIIDDNCVARLCRSIGMDIVTQVEGYQVHHNGRTGTVTVWVVRHQLGQVLQEGGDQCDEGGHDHHDQALREK